MSDLWTHIISNIPGAKKQIMSPYLAMLVGRQSKPYLLYRTWQSYNLIRILSNVTMITHISRKTGYKLPNRLPFAKLGHRVQLSTWDRTKQVIPVHQGMAVTYRSEEKLLPFIYVYNLCHYVGGRLALTMWGVALPSPCGGSPCPHHVGGRLALTMWGVALPSPCGGSPCPHHVGDRLALTMWGVALPSPCGGSPCPHHVGGRLALTMWGGRLALTMWGVALPSPCGGSPCPHHVGGRLTLHMPPRIWSAS